MALISQAAKIEPQILLTEKATRAGFRAAFGSAAKRLKTGDFLFLTYSGHGGQLPDLNGDEDDGLDETWCLFDGQLVDDEIYDMLAMLAPGVRVLVLSDSCHSGSVLKDAAILAAATQKENATRYRAMPRDIVSKVYFANKSFYDDILKRTDFKGKGGVKAPALLISGCQDNQLSSDGPFNGLFTGTLKAVWNGGKFSGNYADFHRAIVRRMPRDQTPNYYTVGPPNAAFEGQRPFQAE